MKRIPVILDGDPGHDDALCWMIAASSPLLEIKAVTTVAGNKDIHNVTNNARKVCALFGIKAPLAQGAPGPLVIPGITAGEFHGKTGLDGVELAGDGAPLSSLSAAELMEKVLEESEEPVVIIGTGAETNLAVLLLHRPDLKKKIKAFYLMGGGVQTGNWNPAAEFNILVDPEAAKIVYESGIPVVMNGLDVTEKALIYPDEVDAIRKIESPIAHIVSCWLDFFGGTHAAMGYTGWPLHDPCAVLSLIHPEMFTMKEAAVSVETAGLFSRGMTTADFEDREHFNAKVVLDIDRKAFVNTLIETVKSYGGSTGDTYEENRETVKEMKEGNVIISISAKDTVDKILGKIPKDQCCSLLLEDGPGNVPLALKIRPRTVENILSIYLPGGSLKRFKKTIFKEAEKLESLLNAGIPVVFATEEAAEKHGLSPLRLAESFAENPKAYRTASCGIHAEYQENIQSRGRLICDLESDHKFKKQNAIVIL